MQINQDSSGIQNSLASCIIRVVPQWLKVWMGAMGAQISHTIKTMYVSQRHGQGLIWSPVLLTAPQL